MVFQDPMSSLDPVYRVGHQIVEQIRVHDRKVSKAQAIRPRGRADGAGRHSARRGSAAVLSARVLRRHAPARDDRDGAVVLAEAADRRRADDRARRDDPGADPRRAAPAARRDGRRGDPRHPRPRRRRRHRRPGGRHVLGPGGRAGHARRASSTTRSTPTRGGCWGRSRGSTRDRSQRLPAIPGMPPSLLRPPKGCHFRPRCPHAFDALHGGPGAEASHSRSSRAVSTAAGSTVEQKRRLRQVGDQIGLAAAETGDLMTDETPDRRPEPQSAADQRTAARRRPPAGAVPDQDAA